MANEFVARNGIIALNNSTITGSFIVTGGITGSLSGSHVGDTTGTASWANNVISSSYALTASFALNAGTITSTIDKITTGSITASVDISAATFRLVSGSSTFLYISSSGNVGIGPNVFPLSKLDIYGSSSVTPLLVRTNDNTNNSAQNIIALTTDNSTYSSKIQVVRGSLSSTLGLAFRVVNATVESEIMRLNTDGNVGIGTAVPAAKLQVSGSANVLNVRGSGSAATQSLFTVDGAAGRLFSVNDSLSGSLFSVNTIAGLPVVEAFSDNTIRIGQYGQRALFVSQSSVGIGVETTTSKLHVSSSTGGVLELDGSGSTNAFYVSSSGEVGVGTTNPGGRFDLVYGGLLNEPSILLGADDNGSINRTNNTTKITRIGVAAYNNSATASSILIADSNATANRVFIGGGSSYMNAANNILFYTAATTASLIGTEILRLSGSGEIIITGSTIITGSLSVSQSILGLGSNIFGNNSLTTHQFTGAVSVTGSSIITGSLSMSGSISTFHLIGNSAVPSVSVGTGAGTGATGGVFGTDLAGSIRVKTGTTPTALAQLGTIYFKVPYNSAPYVLLSPGNTSSAALSSSFAVYVTSSTAGFTVFSNVSALAANAQLTWSYAVFQ